MGEVVKISPRRRTSRLPIVIGQQFGRLTVTRLLLGIGTRRASAVCECQCGNRRIVALSQLRSGGTRSCGCLRREYVAAKNKKHGEGSRTQRTPEYVVWKRMRQRCNDPGTHQWANYGGRGIKIDPRWDDFATFLADVGRKPGRGYTIDRIDNDGDYAPGNVRWATAKEQSRNKRNTIHVLHAGQMVSLAGLAEQYALTYRQLYSRVKTRGWSIERAISTPALR